jgi:hypothetical protein
MCKGLPEFFPGEGEAEKSGYKLMFNPFKVTFTDCSRAFGIKKIVNFLY